jgi:hypothetical protein
MGEAAGRTAPIGAAHWRRDIHQFARSLNREPKALPGGGTAYAGPLGPSLAIGQGTRLYAPWSLFERRQRFGAEEPKVFSAARGR